MDGLKNLNQMFERADLIDLEEGLVAYNRYHLVMQKIANRFAVPIERVIAAFVSLSPNSSYAQNVRSLISCLDGWNKGKTSTEIIVSTYGHCKIRALDYIAGYKSFLDETKGPKILSFYHNIANPADNRWVTVDGHMHCCWAGVDMTMKEALISARQYKIIRDDIRTLAFRNFMLPCQMQAILWFTRKRIANVVYSPQLDLFAAQGDVWRTFIDSDEIKPYRSQNEIQAEQTRGRDGAPDASELSNEALGLHDGQFHFHDRLGREQSMGGELEKQPDRPDELDR